MASGLSTSQTVLQAGAVGNLHISNQALDIIGTDKVQPTYKHGTCFGFAIGATPTTREEIVYVAQSTGTIRGLNALLNNTGSSTAVTFDLKKNGTTVLSATASVTNSDSSKAIKTGTLSVTTFSAGDVFSIAMTVSSSTGAQGPYAWATLVEANAPTS
jgi:hypothetical protein